jgi:predicted nucleic acid-binding protein
MDAYLAAFAIRGKLRLVTLDRDFRSWVPKGLELELLAC